MTHEFVAGFLDEFFKEAAGAGSMKMPPSPLELENTRIKARLDNEKLKQEMEQFEQQKALMEQEQERQQQEEMMRQQKEQQKAMMAQQMAQAGQQDPGAQLPNTPQEAAVGG